MSDLVRYYNLPYHKCSCMDENGQHTRIARNYKRFFDLLKDGKSGIEALQIMKVKRMCCRKRYLVLPILPMIDRSKNRFLVDTKEKVSFSTRELNFGVDPPDFPLL